MGATRRKILAGSAAVLGGLAGIASYSDTSITPEERLEDAYTDIYDRGADGIAEMLLAIDDATEKNPYRAAYEGELPTHENDVVTDIMGVPPDPEQFIQPDASSVKQYAEALDVEHITGQYGILDFGEKELPAYRSGMEQFGRTYIRDPDEFFADGEGNCVDYAVTMASIMEYLGHDSRVILGAVRHQNGEPGMHAVAETSMDNTVYLFDTMNGGNYTTRDSYEELDSVAQWAPVTMFGTDTPYQFYEQEWDR